MLNCDANSRIERWTYKDQHLLKGGLYTPKKKTQNHKKKQQAGLVLQTTNYGPWTKFGLQCNYIWPMRQLKLTTTVYWSVWHSTRTSYFNSHNALLVFSQTITFQRLWLFSLFQSLDWNSYFLYGTRLDLFQIQDEAELVWVRIKRFTVKLPGKYQNCPSLKFGRCVDNWCLCAGVCVRLRRRRAGQLAPLLGGEPLRRGLQEDGRPQRRLWDAGHPPAGQGGQDQPAPVSVTHCDTHPPTDWPTNQL